jgi:predicted transcriptional regulator of viral defense system
VSTLETLAHIAEEHDGVIPAAAARGAGISGVTLVKYAKHGHLERVSRGVYRLPIFPASLARHADLHEALAFFRSGNGPESVLSHETALQLRGLTDVSPALIHVTIPKSVRLRRAVPKRYRVHHSDIDAAAIEHVEGLAVTSVSRTIADIAATGRIDIAQAALRDAAQEGYIERRAARILQKELSLP